MKYLYGVTHFVMMSGSKTSLVLAFILFYTMSSAQTTINLYPGNIPNSKPTKDNEKTEIKNGITIVSRISRPTITAYIPKEKANGTAVIIFPGGGYWVNAIQHEGFDVAKKLNELGITAFVVKYRIPNDSTMENREIGPLQDAQQAIKLVRQRATEWNINPNKIGIMGFSAGGHLASTLGTHYQKSLIDNNEKINLRPDFMILVYPVISFQEGIAHMGSREQIIGKNPSKEKIDLYSNELQVTKDTPPTFLVHAADDATVKIDNSVKFYHQLQLNHVATELYTYAKGGHGFGMKNRTSTEQWMDILQGWMHSQGFL